MAEATLRGIYRYPVKGLTPQRVARTTLAPGRSIAADRLYAIENGPIGFDPAQPVHFPKQRFLMLMRNERLARLRTDYDEATHTLTIQKDGAEAARGDLRTAEGRAAIEAFFADLLRRRTARAAESAVRRRRRRMGPSASRTSPRRSCPSST